MKRKQTGIKYWDMLSDEEYFLARKQAKEFWDSLTVKQRTKLYDVHYENIKRKRLEDPAKYMHLSDKEVIREICNIEDPLLRQRIVEEAERTHNLEVAQYFKKRVVGPDTDLINLFLLD